MAVRVTGNSIRSGHRRKNSICNPSRAGVNSEDLNEMNLLTVSSNRGVYNLPSSISIRGDHHHHQQHQSRESASSDMLPPVRFNILGQMQMRKPPLSPEHCSSSAVKNSTPPDSDARQQHINSGPGRNSTQSQVCTKSENKQSSSSSPLLSSNKSPCSDSEEADSPLDFSTKKVKLDLSNSPTTTSTSAVYVEATHSPEETEQESPCSRLRNILSMKSPVIPENLTGTILNLSKESSNTGWILHKRHSDSRSGSSSCSPVLLDQHQSNHSAFIPSPPRNGVNGMGLTRGAAPGSPLSVSTNLNVVNPLSCSPYGAFSAGSLSPVMNQTVPNVNLPMPFETSSPLLTRIGASSASPTLPFGSSFSATLPSNGSGSASKGRATRPFKAYPKDPMSFSAVGLYGLPLGTTPGSTEAMIHQQSNVAYAEFRKQMLTQAHASRSRRGGQRGNGTDSLLNVSGDHLGYAMDTGAGSSAEDSHSAPEDGGKSTSIKTEQQMKDEAYWERRRKNNEAAKRSRDARRAKEDEIAIRAAFLEQENLKLRFELCALKSETAKLRCMLYSS